MPNQILALHKVSARVYDLTGLRTGSVRDQLLRSNLVAHGLCDDGLIGPSSPLLVIGAGAAGMCAAMTAARRGRQVTVIERNQDPFATFRLARWRRIDPVEYDWPHPHHDLGRFPLPHAPGWFPLEQVTGTGVDLANLWAAVWDDWKQHFDGRGRNGHIEWLGSTQAKPFIDGLDDTQAGHVRVHGPWPGSMRSSRDFGAVMCCAGFGRERTDLSASSPDPWHGYAGPEFWFDDDHVTAGMVTPFPFRRVVISGGGDGAMQDLQRVTTGRFGLDLLRHLRTCPALHAFGQTLEPVGLRLELLMAEECGRRTHAWQRQGNPPARTLAHWHQSFEAAVCSLLAGFDDSLVTALAHHALRPELFDGRLDVTWVFKEATPGYAYALNRFLSLLIQHLALRMGRLARLPNDAVMVLPGHEVAEIKPARVNHRCGRPDRCIGEPHRVRLQPVAGGPEITRHDTTLIVIRHGAERDQTLLKGAAVPEQMTPFDLPT